jgi:hypothetical protein
MRKLMKISAAIVLLPLALWLSTFYANWFVSTDYVASLGDVLLGKPSIVVSFEMDKAKTEVILSELKEQTAQRHDVNAAWVNQLSDANILLVAITDWKHAKFMERVPGLEESSRLAQEKTPTEDRALYKLSQAGKVILVVVIYMYPKLDGETLDCIVGDFTEILAEPFRNLSDPIQTCLDE